MKRIELATLFLLVVVPLSTGQISTTQNCDCTIFPFKPESCYAWCTTKAIANANQLELEIIVGLDKNVAQRIVALQAASRLDVREFYNRVREMPDTEAVLGPKLRSLSKRQIEYLQRPLSQRKGVQNELYLLFGRD